MNQQVTMPEINPQDVEIPEGQTLEVMDWFSRRALRDPQARLGCAEVPGRLRSQVPPRADALHRHRRHGRGSDDKRFPPSNSPSPPW